MTVSLNNLDFEKFNETGSSLFAKIKEHLPIVKIEENLNSYIESIVNLISEKLLNALVNISVTLVDLFLILFMTFFFLIDGKKFLHYISEVLIFKKNQQKIIIRTFRRTIYAVVFGIIYLLVDILIDK